MMRLVFLLLVSLPLVAVGNSSADEPTALRELQKVARIDLDEQAPNKPVVGIYLPGATFKEEFLKLLKQFPHLRELEVGGPISAAGFRDIGELKGLQRLIISAESFQNEDMSGLKSLTELQHIRLAHTKIDDAGLKALPGLSSLRALDLSYCEKITDAGMQYLGRHKGLETLDLTRARVTDIQPLAQLTKLRALNLTESNITDAGLKGVTGMSALENLRLWNTKITDMGGRELRQVRTLRTLDLSFTQVTDEGLKDLAALEQLEELKLQGSRVSDGGVAELKPLKDLRCLTLGSSSDFKGTRLAALNDLPSLRELRIHSTRTADWAVGQLGRNPNPNLEKLTLDRSLIEGSGLQALTGLKKLRELELIFCDNLADQHLAALGKFEHLERLNLFATPIRDAGMKHIKGLKQLQYLNLGATKITDAGLDELKEMSGVRELWLISGQKMAITVEARNKLHKALPKLSIR
jgi:Leucine-rich repeat (LRR) protein